MPFVPCEVSWRAVLGDALLDPRLQDVGRDVKPVDADPRAAVPPAICAFGLGGGLTFGIFQVPYTPV
jgi:hypothetical protein